MARNQGSGRFLALSELEQLLRAPGTELADVVGLIRRGRVSPQGLALLAKEPRWEQEYPLIVALTENPETPLHTSVALVHRLLLHDLGRVTRQVEVPITVRTKALETIRVRLRVLPKGDRAALARSGGQAMAAALIWDPDLEVQGAALSNRRLQEKDLYPLLTHPRTTPAVLARVARDRRWSQRYRVRYLIARHPAVPPYTFFLVAPTLLRQDLEELRERPRLHPLYRRRVERSLAEKILGLSRRERHMVARYASGYSLDIVARSGDVEDARALLDNPHVLPTHLLLLARRPDLASLADLLERHPRALRRRKAAPPDSPATA